MRYNKNSYNDDEDYYSKDYSQTIWNRVGVLLDAGVIILIIVGIIKVIEWLF